MKQDYRQLLQPKIINSISGLSLIARVIVDGFLSGLNRSRRVGTGIEFSQYKAYQAGDDLRLLDWKMVARSGRYFIKQSEIETHSTIKFIVDTSKSMLHEEGGLSKMEYAKVLVASLAQLAQKQGDTVGLFGLNDSKLVHLQAVTDKRQNNRFLHELVELKAEGKWPKKSVALEHLHTNGRKELLFLITDMYEHSSELTTLVKSLKTARNEVAVLQLMGDKEMDFSYGDFVVFEDLETGEKVKVDTKSARSEYQNALTAQRESIKNMLLTQGIGYHLFQLGTPIEEALQLFLKQRSYLR